MKIIVKNIPYSQVITMGAYIRAGSFHEKNVYGAAHFVEHMLFNGTKNRTSQRIMYDIEGIGGEFDASTTYDYTEYIITVPLKYWTNALDVLLDMLFNYDFDENKFSREQKIIIDELGENMDDTAEFLSDLIQQKMFREYPNRQSIAGTPTQVKAITINDLYSFLKGNYRPDNMYLVVTGNISYSEVVNEAAKRIHLTEAGSDGPDIFSYPVLDAQNYTFKKDIEQFYWGIGMFAPSYHLRHTKERYAMEILVTLLGGNGSSRLFQSIREDRGLAYTVDLNYEPLSDTGLLTGIFSSNNRKNIPDIKEIVLGQLVEVRKELQEDEIARAKAYIEGILTIRSEEQMFLNNYIGENYLYNNRYTALKEYIRGIRMMEKRELYDVAEKYFQTGNMLFVELIPG